MVTDGVDTRRESEARRRMLESECGAEPPVDSSFCERYAEESVGQQAENLRRDCGFSGAGWTESLESHLEWCLSVSSEEAREALRIRRRAFVEACVVEPEMVRAPPVEGMALEPALRRIAGVGLVAERVDEPSARAPGTVLRQEPEAGSLVQVGTLVPIWVAYAEPPEPPGPSGPAEPTEPPGLAEPLAPPRRPEPPGPGRPPRQPQGGVTVARPPPPPAPSSSERVSRFDRAALFGHRPTRRGVFRHRPAAYRVCSEALCAFLHRRGRHPAAARSTVGGLPCPSAAARPSCRSPW